MRFSFSRLASKLLRYAGTDSVADAFPAATQLEHPLLRDQLEATYSAASLAKFFAIETFAGWIKLTQFFQIVFLFCAAISTWALERNLRLVLLVVFVTALYASTWNFLIPTPNNTGFRFLGFALLPLALAILKKYDGLSGALIASMASAVFILWNTETGLACSSALLFYMFVSEIANRRTVLGALSLTSLGFAASFFLSCQPIYDVAWRGRET